jgi:hypothetical protein
VTLDVELVQVDHHVRLDAVVETVEQAHFL